MRTQRWVNVRLGLFSPFENQGRSPRCPLLGDVTAPLARHNSHDTVLKLELSYTVLVRGIAG
jgi:hypothetical protein